MKSDQGSHTVPYKYISNKLCSIIVNWCVTNLNYDKISTYVCFIVLTNMLFRRKLTEMNIHCHYTGAVTDRTEMGDAGGISYDTARLLCKRGNIKQAPSQCHRKDWCCLNSMTNTVITISLSQSALILLDFEFGY